MREADVLAAARLCSMFAVLAILIPIGSAQFFGWWFGTDPGFVTALISWFLVWGSLIGAFRVATSNKPSVRTAAVFAVIWGVCALSGMVLEFIAWGGNGIGNALLIMVGYPGLLICSLFAWLGAEVSAHRLA